MTLDSLTLELNPSEVQIIRLALRLQQDNHKRNDFKVLESAVAELRDKVANATIDQSLTRI